MMRHSQLVLSVLPALVLCSSCRFLDPDLVAPEGTLVPDSYGQSGEGTARSRDTSWWAEFRSPSLDEAIRQSLSGNLGLEESYSRLEQAKALARQAGSGTWVTVDGEASASSSRSRRLAGGTYETDGSNSFTLGLAASYEVDLWGRVRASVRSAELETGAAAMDVRTAAISVAADVADRWFRVVALRAELGILRQQIETNRRYLELLELRQRRGMATALDVLQQRQVVAAGDVRIPQRFSRQTAPASADTFGRGPRRTAGGSARYSGCAAAPGVGGVG